MSNILKSKSFLGTMIASALFVGVVLFAFAFATTASAQLAPGSSCTISITLKVGSKGDQVKCLQTAVGVAADGSFGP